MTFNLIFQFVANGLGYVITVFSSYFLESNEYIFYLLSCSIAVLVVGIIEVGFVQSLVAQRKQLADADWQAVYSAYRRYVFVICLITFICTAITAWHTNERSFLLFGGVLAVLLLLRSENIAFHAESMWMRFRVFIALPNVIRLSIVALVFLLLEKEAYLESIAEMQFGVAIVLLGLMQYFSYQDGKRCLINRDDIATIKKFLFSGGWYYFIGIIIISMIVRAEQVWVVQLSDGPLAAALLAIIALGSVFSVASTAIMQYLLVATRANSRARHTRQTVITVVISIISTLVAYIYGDAIVGSLYPNKFLLAAPYLWLIILSHTLGLAAIAYETFALSERPEIYVMGKMGQLACVAIIAPLAAKSINLFLFFAVVALGRTVSWAICYIYYRKECSAFAKAI